MTQEALKLAEIIEHFDSNDESLPLELLKEISATLRALALQALHDENERLGLYKEAYAQPEQEPKAWHEIVLNQKQFLEKMEWLLAKTASPPWRERVLFPTMPRKMWSGGEVQQWLDENVNKENT